MNPEYAMLLETFMETAKAQNQSLVDGAIFVFIPRDGTSPADASIFSWISEESERSAGHVWHDAFISMLWALIKSGVGVKEIRKMIDYAEDHVESITASELESAFEEGDLN